MKKIVGLILSLLVMCFFFTGCSSSTSSSRTSSSSTRSTKTCGYCGKQYSAGDAGGNYMNIAKTNLCKSCYAFYKSANNALGK